MPHATINNVSLCYEVYGDETAEPLVMVTGFSGNRYVWANIIERLAEHFRVITFDNRGSGESEQPDASYSIELLAEDTCALMDHLNIKKANILGHSMGTMIATMMTQMFPDRVNKIILEAPACFSRPHILAFFDSQLDLRKNNIDRRLMFQTVIPLLFGESFFANKDIIEEIIELHCAYPFPISVAGYNGQLHAIKSFNSESFISDVQHQALVLVGEEDMMLPMRDGLALADAMPNAEVVKFEKTGHMIHLEADNKFLKHVIEFLN